MRTQSISDIELGRAISKAADQVGDANCYLEQSFDFERIVEELLSSSKARINAEASPFENELGENNACYLIARGEDGSLQGFVSVRILDIGSERLIGYWRRQFRRIYGQGQEVIQQENAAPPAYSIQGKTGFISDIFIEKSSRGAGRLNVTALMMAAIAVLATRWNPDWIYGFAKNRDVQRGLAGRYLTTGLYPNAVKWLSPPENRRDDDWLLCFSREDYHHTLKSYLDG